jgi:hypothetical protein
MFSIVSKAASREWFSRNRNARTELRGTGKTAKSVEGVASNIAATIHHLAGSIRREAFL